VIVYQASKRQFIHDTFRDDVGTEREHALSPISKRIDLPPPGQVEKRAPDSVIVWSCWAPITHRMFGILPAHALAMEC